VPTHENDGLKTLHGFSQPFSRLLRLFTAASPFKEGRHESMRRRPNGTSEPAADAERSVWEALASPQPHGLRQRLRATLWQTRTVLLLSAVAVGLLALLYLHVVGDVALANSQLQTLHAQHTRLVRQDEELHQQLGVATSPAYIDREARKLGLEPTLPLPAPPLPIPPSVQERGATGGQP